MINFHILIYQLDSAAMNVHYSMYVSKFQICLRQIRHTEIHNDFSHSITKKYSKYLHGQKYKIKHNE